VSRFLGILATALLVSCAQIAGLGEHMLAGDGGVDGPNAAGPDASIPDGGSSLAGAGGSNTGAVGGSNTGGAGGSIPTYTCQAPGAPMCPDGVGDCHGTGCVMSLTSDQDNCGFCGRSCHGGECQDADCLPLVIADDQHLGSNAYIAVRGAGIVWGTKDGTIYLKGLESGAQPVPLATGEGNIYRMAADDDFVYVMVDQGTCTGAGTCLRRFSIVPNKYPPTTLTRLGYDPGGVTADATAVYWYDRIGSVMRLPTHGSAPATPQALATNQGEHGNDTLAIDGEYIYWASQGDTESIVKRTRLDGTSLAPQHLVSGLTTASAVAVDDTNVYWTNYKDQTIQMAPKDGTGSVTTLATETAFPPLTIAVDEVNVYWGSDGGHPGLHKVSKCGGKIRPMKGVDRGVFSAVPWKGNVYWADESRTLFWSAQ
jgi:hypothetical protein